MADTTPKQHRRGDVILATIQALRKARNESGDITAEDVAAFDEAHTVVEVLSARGFVNIPPVEPAAA